MKSNQKLTSVMSTRCLDHLIYGKTQRFPFLRVQVTHRKANEILSETDTR